MTDHPKDTNDAVRYPDAWCRHVLDRPEPDLEDVMTKPTVPLEEMQILYRAYVSCLETGRDRIIDFSGDCDPVDVMEDGDPALRRARAVMAAAKLTNERCPGCNLNWRLFAPAQISGLPMVRCVECKRVYDEDGSETNG